MTERRCELCRFYQAKDPTLPHDPDWAGECRKQTPLEWGWPSVKADHWCGEFEPQPIDPPESESECQLSHVSTMKVGKEYGFNAYSFFCMKCGATKVAACFDFRHLDVEHLLPWLHGEEP